MPSGYQGLFNKIFTTENTKDTEKGFIESIFSVTSVIRIFSLSVGGVPPRR